MLHRSYQSIMSNGCGIIMIHPIPTATCTILYFMYFLCRSNVYNSSSDIRTHFQVTENIRLNTGLTSQQNEQTSETLQQTSKHKISSTTVETIFDWKQNDFNIFTRSSKSVRLRVFHDVSNTSPFWMWCFVGHVLLSFQSILKQSKKKRRLTVPLWLTL